MAAALAQKNWEAALSAVERNKGAPGPDGRRASELRAHLASHGEVISKRLREGICRPGASKRRDIPKPSGGTRPLSIPNVQDRFVQQLLLGVLQPVFEPRFSEGSYGFRPGYSTHDSVKAAQGFTREGFSHVVDMDVTKFLDKVNHDILMTKIGNVIGDKAMMKRIGKFLRAGVVMPDGLEVSSEEATPQGGPLSRLLANIYLDSLEKELEKRYLDSLTGWVKRHLRREVSASKSGVGCPWERKFLGFSVTAALLIGIAPASFARFKDQVRQKWDARQSLTSEELRDQWRGYIQGCWGYYRQSEWRPDIFEQEGWIRRHIRKCFWQRWHGSEGRLSALRRLGLPVARAEVGRNSRGAWRMAASPTMEEALNDKTLKRCGFVMPSDLKS